MAGSDQVTFGHFCRPPSAHLADRHASPSIHVPKTFEIKSAQLPLVSLLLHSSDLQQLGLELRQQYGGGSDNADFFDNDGLVLDLSRLPGPIAPGDMPALLQALTDCRLKPLAFRGVPPGDRAAWLALGLIEAAPEPAPRARPAPAPVAAVATPAPPPPEAAPPVPPVAPVQPAPGTTTLVVDKPVRSGQKVYARGADLVLLSMVNAGAEVVADGNIHVYAPLRGKAMAGASGNVHARIFSTCLEPELISIAGVYRTSENPLAPHIQGKAAQVRLSDDGQEKLLFEPLSA